MCFHNLYLFGNLQYVPQSLFKFIQAGEAAVSFFFILSGFILTHVYQQRLSSKPEKRIYLISRLAKLYPLYFLGMLLDIPRVIQYFLSQYDTLAAFLKAGISGFAYLLMIQSWFRRLATTWNAPAWSLSCEIFFYIVFIFVMRPLLNTKHKTASLIIFYLIPPLLFLFLIKGLSIQSPSFTAALLMFPPLRIFEFFVGICLYGLLETQNVLVSWVQKRASLVFWMSLFVSVGLTHFHQSPIDGKIFSQLILVPFFYIMILSASFDTVQFKEIFTNRVVYYLGLASYAVYILHQPLKNYFVPLMEPSVTLGSIYFIMLIIISCLAHQYFELPLRKTISKKLKDKFSR